MKKKLLLGVTGLALLFGFVLAACDTNLAGGADFNLKDQLNSIASPEIKEQKAAGGVLFTWPLVENAAGYEIWRQRITEPQGTAQQIGTVPANAELRYADVKSLTNPLEADVEYKYTVIAVSQASTSVSSTSGVVVQNGKAEKTVKFETGELTLPTLTAVAGLELKETFGGGVVATWTPDTNPLVSYKVTWHIQPESSPAVRSGTTSASHFSISTPGASNTVSVVKVLGDNGSPAADAFLRISKYSDAVSLTTGFSASRDSNTSVKIEMPIVPGAALTQYKVSRAKTGFGGQMIDNAWSPVAISAVQEIPGTSSSPVYMFYDSTAAGAVDNWVYRLIVEYDNGSIYGLAYAPVSAIPAGTLQALNLSFVANSVYPATPSTTYDDLEAYGYLTYNTEGNVDYTLYRKQVSGPNGTLPTSTAYDWVVVPVAAGDKTSGTYSERVKVTLPDARTKYDFKVVAVGKGAKLGYQVAEDTIGNSGESLRSSIRPSSVSSPSDYALTYTLNGSDYTLIGTQDDTSSNPVNNVYRLNLQGLSGSGGGSFLRSGESLVVEVSTGGAYTIAATLTQRQSINTGTAASPTAQSADWYFTLPSATASTTDVRLAVVAK